MRAHVLLTDCPVRRVRARGQRRHRRPILTSAVAASAIFAALVGGAFAAIDQLTNPAEPSSAGPVQTVGPSTTPDPVLLTAEQTRFHEQGEFQLTTTVHGEGVGELSTCQRDTLASVGATDVWRRDFGWPPGPAPDTTIRTAVMRFADEDAAGAAYAELTEWMEDCAD
jgi:hypothetical protein